MLLDTHSPLDLVIVMLGTNDTKTRIHVPVSDIGLGWTRIADTVLRGFEYTEGSVPRLLLVAPPVILPSPGLTETFEGAVEKSMRFAEILGGVAKQFGCHFFNSGDVVQSSPIDGIHLSPESQVLLGKTMASLASKILVG
jgi:lysophospholipase L1-like esterase